MTTFYNQTAKRFYFDTPQTDKLQAFTVQSDTGVLAYGTFTNTGSEESKVTITLNGSDILYEKSIGVGANEVIPFNIALQSGDVVYIKQSVINAVNVSLNGSVG